MIKLRLKAGSAALAALLAAGVFSPARAERAPGRLVAAGVVVANATREALACTAALAHWNAVALGAAPPGARLTVALRQDPATGALYLLNAAGRPMALETLWCEASGRRTALPLARRAGAVADGAVFACRAEGAHGLACRAEP